MARPKLMRVPLARQHVQGTLVRKVFEGLLIHDPILA